MNELKIIQKQKTFYCKRCKVELKSRKYFKENNKFYYLCKYCGFKIYEKKWNKSDMHEVAIKRWIKIKQRKKENIERRYK